MFISGKLLLTRSCQFTGPIKSFNLHFYGAWILSWFVNSNRYPNQKFSSPKHLFNKICELRTYFFFSSEIFVHSKFVVTLFLLASTWQSVHIRIFAYSKYCKYIFWASEELDKDGFESGKDCYEICILKSSWFQPCLCENLLKH